MLKKLSFFLLILLLLSNCGLYERHALNLQLTKQRSNQLRWQAYPLTRKLEDQILALNPQHVTEQQVKDILSHAPAPRIIIIHGGAVTSKIYMQSFGRLLVGMGYPKQAIVNPNDGTWTFSCYENTTQIAGMIPWYYEKEGLRPMLIGHSQGGMQVIRILDIYADKKQVYVWNPLTWSNERRYQITDPLTGKIRPVAGFTLPYVVSANAGGLTRLLPNQWDMNFRLRIVPNTAEEFTGFYKGLDPLGGDLLGYSALNYFKAKGKAKVRNVQMPAVWKHTCRKDMQKLLQYPDLIRDINRYHPSHSHRIIAQNKDTMNPKTMCYPIVQDIWFSIKKHWVLELQNLIKAKRNTYTPRI